MKHDLRTINAFRKIFHEANKVWCQDESKRLKMFVEEHFVERLFERFKNDEAAQVVKDILAHIKKNYEILQFEDTFGTKREYRIPLSNGNRAVLILFSGTLRIRTCFKPGQEE